MILPRPHRCCICACLYSPFSAAISLAVPADPCTFNCTHGISYLFHLFFILFFSRYCNEKKERAAWVVLYLICCCINFFRSRHLLRYWARPCRLGWTSSSRTLIEAQLRAVGMRRGGSRCSDPLSSLIKALVLIISMFLYLLYNAFSQIK